MKAWHIAYYTILRNLRNWKLLVLLIFLPLVFYLLCLYVTANINPDLKTTKIRLAYFNAGSTAVAWQFEQYLQSPEILTAFEVQKTDSFAAGNNLVQKGEIDAFICLKDNSAPGLSEQGKTVAEIYSNKNSSLIQLLAAGFGSMVNFSPTGLAAANNASGAVSAGILPMALSPPGKVLKESDKFPFLGLLEMLSYGLLLGSFAVISSRQKNIRLRADIAPIKRYAFVGGQYTATFLTLCLSSCLLIAYIYFLWGDLLQGKAQNIFLVFLLFTLTITALGMIIGYGTKKTGLCALAAVIINSLLSSAAFSWALGTAQGFLLGILYLSPHYHTYLIVTDTIFEGPGARIQLSFLSLALITIVLTAGTFLLGRRKAP